MVIPTLNAADEIGSLIESLQGQTVSLYETMIIDSSSDDKTVEIASKYKNVRTHVIERKDFNHGLTRDMALKMCSGDIVLFMTQDAIPYDEFYVENLIKPLLEDPFVAMSSGRQLPREDARRFEQLVREFNYPSQSNIRSKEDISTLGIKAFFASDVCAAYRKSYYLECGGFEEVNTNEDMLMAATFLSQGYKVAYSADACVHHSHNLTLREQYKRNKRVGIFLKKYANRLGDADGDNEGIKLIKSVSNSLVSEKLFFELLCFYADCTARFIGNRVGGFITL